MSPLPYLFGARPGHLLLWAELTTLPEAFGALQAVPVRRGAICVERKKERLLYKRRLELRPTGFSFGTDLHKSLPLAVVFTRD